MKLQQLDNGARFEYQGQIFVKTGPVTASNEQGNSQILPCYAVLKPLDLPEKTSTGMTGRRLDARMVRRSFDTFYQSCADCIPADKLPDLAKARETFLSQLKI